MKDVSKNILIGTEEEKARITETAKHRVFYVQTAAADLFAASLVLCSEQPPDLQESLWQAQETFFSRIADEIPVTVQASDETIYAVRAIEPATQNIILVANHPPFEKTISPTGEQLVLAFKQLDKSNIADSLDNLTNLPAGIMRRAVLDRVMHTLYPTLQFRHHVVGSRYRPPLNVVQEKDGTIIVPYAHEETDGFSKLLFGMQRVFEQSDDPGHKHVVVAFPEGEQPQTIETLKKFHSGIFAAQAKFVYEKHLPITMIPVCMAVQKDFSIQTQVKEPIILPPKMEDYNAGIFAASVQDMFQQTYTDMLQSSKDGYYWQGMTYPFGGISRSDILKIAQK